MSFIIWNPLICMNISQHPIITNIVIIATQCIHYSDHDLNQEWETDSSVTMIWRNTHIRTQLYMYIMNILDLICDTYMLQFHHGDCGKHPLSIAEYTPKGGQQLSNWESRVELGHYRWTRIHWLQFISINPRLTLVDANRYSTSAHETGATAWLMCTVTRITHF